MKSMKVCVLVLIALCCEVAAHPTVGSASRSVVISRGGAALSPNAAYVPDEALTVTLSNTEGEYIFVTTGATFPGGACSATRSLEISSTLRMPAAG
eukprot:CAMPEP_0173374592 /NCGR_PEP_ID=MMETSP1144-20121109/29156_1 /TAXON_ID=483371 /ORGANISM="non described non described, Strain CCMP2298" /LENGTH=95 /DNA_ID=CAMNT_0014326929 /DNA_START=272 /DNA_END=556 /DNA_ORIENTATION=+